MAIHPQKIVPHLWFDREALEAAAFYCSIFPDSRITQRVTLHATPSGDVEVVTFQLRGYSFAAISAGPLTEFNPSISFMVTFDHSQDEDATTRIDTVWAKLAEGGQVLIPLDRYPFSERYGWIRDRYGLSWQLILTSSAGAKRSPIVPFLLFTGEKYGRAEEASDFYLSVFRHSMRGTLVRHAAGMEPDTEGTVMFTDFMLEGQWFAAMDSAYEHGFTFNEVISFLVNCDDQNEIDYYWDKLTADPEAEQCGWLKDKYGLSWQIVPRTIDAILSDPNPERARRVTQAFLEMKKIDIARLESL